VEILYFITAFVVVFLCLGSAYFGYTIGAKNRETHTIERTIERTIEKTTAKENGKVTTQENKQENKTEEYKDAEPAPKPEKPKEGELTLEEQMKNWNGYDGR
jgi:low affinity Fe/Cu permease